MINVIQHVMNVLEHLHFVQNVLEVCISPPPTSVRVIVEPATSRSQPLEVTFVKLVQQNVVNAPV